MDQYHATFECCSDHVDALTNQAKKLMQYEDVLAAFATDSGQLLVLTLLSGADHQVTIIVHWFAVPSPRY